MGLLPILLALALAGTPDTPPPTEPPTARGRMCFLWFLSAAGLTLDYILEREPGSSDEEEPAEPAVFCAQLHLGLTGGPSIAGDWTLERPLTIRLPGRGLGATVWVGAAPEFWRWLRGIDDEPDAGE